MQTKNIGAQYALFINLNTVVGILYDNYWHFFLQMCNSARFTSTKCRTPNVKFSEMVLFRSDVGTYIFIGFHHDCETQSKSFHVRFHRYSPKKM